MKKFIKSFSVFLTFIITLLFSLVVYGDIALPDEASTQGAQIVFSRIYSAQYKAQSISPVSMNGIAKKTSTDSEIKLFGAIPVKSIRLEQTERRHVAVGGELIGIRLKTEGVLVVGTESFLSENGTVCPAGNAGIVTGDTLISIDGKSISLNSELSQIISDSDGNELTAVILRDGERMTLTLKPEKDSATGIYKGGLWIRDSTGGIGTLTYTDVSTGTLAALGHGIYDVDTGKLMPANHGIFVSAFLSGITKGTNGTAGELRGSLGNEYLGDISINCENGIFGSTKVLKNFKDILPVAFPEEVKTGDAQIITTVNGKEKCTYNIKIDKINTNEESRNMIIRVTDPTLLSLTGGIVQGMSGSPIIQNGMFVGAVTHVFLNDPTKGYGILAENMLEQTQNEDQQAA